MTRQEVLSLFVGADRAEVERALLAAANQMHVGETLDPTQVIALLDLMATAPGGVGVAARFAKVRALLLPKAPRTPRR